MNLAKTSLLSFISTGIKILAGLVINKAVSIYVGPAGLALIGQFQNFSQIAMTAATGGINNGVVKYTAEYGRESEKTLILMSAAFKITLACSLFSGLLIIFFSRFFSEYFLSDDDYQYIFIVFGFTIVLFSVNQLLLSLLNGLREIKKYLFINVIQSLYSLFFTTALVYFWHLDGALIALVTNQSVVFFIIIFLLRKHDKIKLENFTKKFSSIEGRKLLGYAVIAITSAVTVPVAQLWIRNYLGESIGWSEAGYWQAMWYISTMYLMVVTTALSIYYLPRLSEIDNRAELKLELINGYKLVIPIVMLLSYLIFIFKDLIVSMLFTNDFVPMTALFKWQLMGDVVKLGSWLLGYVLIAKAMIKVIVITEIVFSITFCVFSYFFTSIYGLEGMSMAHFSNYTLHFFTMLLIVLRYRLI
jgi:O-antigen/teichoic acid export membrane protein